MWDHPRMAWSKYWIIIGSLVQAQVFSTTVVKEGEDAILECGIQTKVEEGYLKWEARTNDTTVVLAYDLRDGFSNCDDRIINCTIHANGSIQLESVDKEDGARYYRCLRGDEHGYNYYSDHRLLVLSKEKTSSPPSIETPHRESVSSYNIDKKGVLHGYNAPVCEDDVDGNLPVVCYPPSGIIVDREYETIQCNCTDSDGLMDSVTFHVTRQMSSRPSFGTPHRESASAYDMGKKGVLHSYNALVCEDDVDGNLPVVCHPPSGVIVDREYETIQCNCTDSDGLMDSVTFHVTSVTHWVHPGWRKASISLLVVILILISIIVFVIWICRNLCKILKTSNTNREHAAAYPEEMISIQSSTKEQQISDMEDKIATPEATFSKTSTQSESQQLLLKPLQDMLEVREMMEKKMKNKLEEQHENFSKISEQGELQVMLLKQLKEMMEMQEMMETKKNNLEENLKKVSKISEQGESQVMLLKQLHEILEMQEMLETKKNNLEENLEKGMNFAKEQAVKGRKNRDLNKLLEEKQGQGDKIDLLEATFSKRSTQSKSQEMHLKRLQKMLEELEMLE